MLKAMSPSSVGAERRYQPRPKTVGCVPKFDAEPPCTHCHCSCHPRWDSGRNQAADGPSGRVQRERPFWEIAEDSPAQAGLQGGPVFRRESRNVGDRRPRGLQVG